MERRYQFWLETEGGERVAWTHLSERQALEMYRRTRAAHPDGVRLFGWGPHHEPPFDAVNRERFTYL